MNHKMGEHEFLIRTVHMPRNGDLDRINCDNTGEPGHWNCGWCKEHNLPRYNCMCRAPEPEKKRGQNG